MAARAIRAPKKDSFLEAFAKTGNVSEAAAAAGVGRRTVYDWRSEDEDFATRWDGAEQESHDRLEREAFRRAAEGTDKPVFQGGQQVGTIHEYSDTLLIFLLKARRPAVYRDNHRVELTGADGGPMEVTTDVSDAVERFTAAVTRLAAGDGPTAAPSDTP